MIKIYIDKPALTALYDYEPFGKPRPLALAGGATEEERLAYIGKEKDQESDLGDHGVRKYDYETGRFTSTDMLWEKYAGWSPYHYCGNNPVSRVDWNGQEAWAVTSSWSKDDIKGYQDWYANNAINYVGQKAECAKLQFLMRAGYAKEQGLPLIFKTSSGTLIDAQSDNFKDFNDFKLKGLGKLSSKDILANVEEIPDSEKQPGDMVKLLLTNLTTLKSFKHVVGFVDVATPEKPQIIYGNLIGNNLPGPVTKGLGSWIYMPIVRTKDPQKPDYSIRIDHNESNTVLRFKTE